MRLKYLFVFLFSLLLGASGLAGLPPIDRDEARFVQATKQMAETGNYIDIRLQQETRYKKPIGIYWLQSAAVALSGQGPAAPVWVYRLVSMLGIALAALATAWTGTRLFGGNAGLAAGLVVRRLPELRDIDSVDDLETVAASVDLPWASAVREILEGVAPRRRFGSSACLSAAGGAAR